MALKIWTNQDLKDAHTDGVKHGKELAHNEMLRFLRKIQKLAYGKTEEAITNKIRELEKE